ncbi:histidine kinase [Pikeienuella piscinae]|uniref:Histidine kinase n=1 Tax=Pikeienuella piscinae TaxID=2748098 RepID=A0A7L5BVX3_9RHOB|nr:DUF6446 family protein [Pikeienuella piscinae]QIE54667.1 histidine kinase [Pikeienuella piscinae]
MNGRFIVIGLALFALVFGAALWWFQTRGYYHEVTGVTSVTVAGAAVPVSDYQGIDADTSPLKMRGCFRAEGLSGPEAPEAEPHIAPGWFECFDAGAITADLASGAATAVRAASNEPHGFDRIIAVYPDGRAFQWRQINRCGKAEFAGDPPPEGCRAPETD